MQIDHRLIIKKVNSVLYAPFPVQENLSGKPFVKIGTAVRANPSEPIELFVA